jgi:ketosteroid isomerase-like protein
MEDREMSGAKLLQDLYAAFGRGDVPTVLGAMAPDVRWYEAEGNPYMPSGDAWEGPDAIVANLFAKLAEEWNGFTVHPVAFHDAGDTVTVEGRYTGEYKQTGQAIDAQFCHVWTLAGGKITKFQQYADTGQFQDAMGARP